MDKKENEVYKGSLDELIKEQKKEWDAKPWYSKVYEGTKDFIEGDFYSLKEWLKEKKYDFQRVQKGYADCDLWNLNDFIVKRVRAPLKEFIRYQETQGHGLPEEFATDPAAWLVVLSKMEYAFDSYWYDRFEDEDPRIKGFTSEQMTEHYKKVREGFELFGRHLEGLWD